MPIITVHGIPAAQGSKRHLGNGIMIEMSKKVKPWREAVKWAWIESKHAMVAGPVNLSVVFYFNKPKTSKRKYPSVAPDLDKVLRSTFDSLTQVSAIEDDSRIVKVTASKEYGVGFQGAIISVEPAA